MLRHTSQLLLILSAYIALGKVNGQVTQFGFCLRIRIQPDFNAELYTGRWYEQEKFPALFERNQICITADYSQTASGRIRIQNRGYNHVQGRFVSISGDAIQNPANPSQLGVRFFPGQPRQAYNVLTTDYYGYSLVFSCEQSRNALMPTSRQYLWILSRDRRGIPPFIRQRLLMIAHIYGINTQFLTFTEQQNCPREH